MRIIARRRCRRPVDTETQLIDQFGCECRTVLNSAILIPRQVKGRESRQIGARRCSDIWHHRSTVIDGVAREDRMRIGKAVVDASHAVVLTTLVKIEKGDPGVAIGIYATV